VMGIPLVVSRCPHRLLLLSTLGTQHDRDQAIERFRGLELHVALAELLYGMPLQLMVTARNTP
jgi:hypothetical protein